VKPVDTREENDYLFSGGRMKYWSNAFLGLGVTLIAAIIIKFDLLGLISGIVFLFAGYVCHRKGGER
jgi:hypothetical protein